VHIRSEVADTLKAVWRGEGGRRSTNENLTKDGRIIMCDWHNTPLVGSDGAVMGVASLVQDITQRLAAEAELREAKEAAEASDRTKSEFLANISHELRTPLNAIIGFSEVIGEALLGPVGTPRYIEYARDIRDSGVHLLSIINDLLDISKIEAGRFELHEEEASPHELMDASLRLVRERAEKGGLRCEASVPADLPQLAVDPRAMKQVLLNLLSNAVKFTAPGGSVRATAHLDATGGVVFQVTDSGIGIKPEDIPRALAPFTQIDSQFTRRHEGTGLGLPLAKKLVELHGGRLDLTSVPGKGTTVTVRLPAVRVILPRKVANHH
jgi:signal transduction histidine kinase